MMENTVLHATHTSLHAVIRKGPKVHLVSRKAVVFPAQLTNADGSVAMHRWSSTWWRRQVPLRCPAAGTAALASLQQPRRRPRSRPACRGSRPPRRQRLAPQSRLSSKPRCPCRPPARSPEARRLRSCTTGESTQSAWRGDGCIPRKLHAAAPARAELVSEEFVKLMRGLLYAAGRQAPATSPPSVRRRRRRRRRRPTMHGGPATPPWRRAPPSRCRRNTRTRDPRARTPRPPAALKASPAAAAAAAGRASPDGRRPPLRVPVTTGMRCGRSHPFPCSSTVRPLALKPCITQADFSWPVRSTLRQMLRQTLNPKP